MSPEEAAADVALMLLGIQACLAVLVVIVSILWERRP